MPQFKCIQCSKDFERRNSEIKTNIKKNKTNNIFCSRSCSVTFNNKISPKRKRSESHKEIYESNLKRSSIRKESRKIAKQLNWTSCKKCGYNKHIEVCHIQPVSSFSKDTPIEIINDPSNLIPLCPNCHWEHDNPN